MRLLLKKGYLDFFVEQARTEVTTARISDALESRAIQDLALEFPPSFRLRTGI